jgi:hypothetical protein
MAGSYIDGCHWQWSCGIHHLSRKKKGSGAMSKRKSDVIRETLRGVVTPIKWDGDQITEVALSATDDEEYHIENSDKFFDLIQAFIEATGVVRRTKKSFRSINI